ncbi:MAG: hypothetical protein IKU57_02915 [Oscillospiraceae bacterium]|nr:hypothetical protein [Oscillospiraceae bacterium]
MLLYAGIMFATAALFAVLAALIYRGKTDLIHDYHRTKVTDNVAYGKAFGKAMAVISMAMACSGIVALFGERVMWIAVWVLLLGLLGGILAILLVQKKYKGGMF